MSSIDSMMVGHVGHTYTLRTYVRKASRLKQTDVESQCKFYSRPHAPTDSEE